MVKCYLHGESGGDDKEKSSKPLKEHPGFPDNNYQQNLDIILTPKIKEIDFENLNKKLASIEQEKEDYKKEQGKLEQEVQGWKDYCQFLKQEEKSKDVSLTKLEKNLKDKEKDISTKNAQIQEQNKRLTNALAIFKEQKKSIEEKQKNINELEIKWKNSEPKDDHVYSFLTHLQEDLKLEKETKAIIEKRVKDLELQLGDDKLARDTELQDLKEKVAKQAQTIKDLTEVKMKREESEERLRKQSEDFLQVQNMNKMVYDILGEYSKQNGLLLRSQEVVKKLKKTEKEALSQEEKIWLEKLHWMLGGGVLWNKQQMDNLTKTTDIHQLQDLYKYRPKKVAGFGIMIGPSTIADSLRNIFDNYISLNQQLQKELGWWDKWINSGYQHFFEKSPGHVERIRWPLNNQNDNISLFYGSENAFKIRFREWIYKYYRDK